MTGDIMINQIPIRIRWSKRMTCTRLKLLDYNSVKASKLLIKSDEDLKNLIIEICLNETTFIDYSKIIWIRGKKLGEGGFAKVYSCKNNKNVVLKIYKTTRDSEKKIYDILNNGSIYIPKIFGSGIFPDNALCLVLERFKLDLNILLKSKIDVRLSKTIAKDLISSLEFIHNLGYVHCDIKPHNIFLTNDTLPCRAVLGDFDMCRLFETSEYKILPSMKRFGTLNYMSCDIHDRVNPSRRSDMYSLGLVVIELFNGQLPWKNLDVYFEINKLKQSYRASEFVSEFLQDCFIDINVPECVLLFVTNVLNLEYNDKPNYEWLKSIFN